MIETGKIIYALLKGENSTIPSSTTVSPLVAENGTQFPFIVYKRNSLTPATSKDCFVFSYEVIEEISICSDDYEESVNIAENVINELNGKRGLIQDIQVLNIELMEASEEYNENSYIQTLTFRIKLK